MASLLCGEKKKSGQHLPHRGYPMHFFPLFLNLVAVGLFLKFTRDATWHVVTAGATSAHAFAVFWIHYSADTESCCPSGAPPPAVCLSAPAALLVYICMCSQCVRSVGKAALASHDAQSPVSLVCVYCMSTIFQWMGDGLLPLWTACGSHSLGSASPYMNCVSLKILCMAKMWNWRIRHLFLTFASRSVIPWPFSSMLICHYVSTVFNSYLFQCVFCCYVYLLTAVVPYALTEPDSHCSGTTQKIKC